MNRSLVDVAQRKLHEGSLPLVPQFRTYAGRSAGGVCALCEAPLPRGSIEIELEWRERGERHTVTLHLDCEAAWQAALEATRAAGTGPR